MAKHLRREHRPAAGEPAAGAQPGPAATPSVRLDDSQPFVSREQLVVGFGVSHEEKLRRAGAVDLHDNARLERTAAGYLRVLPRDPERRHG